MQKISTKDLLRCGKRSYATPYCMLVAWNCFDAITMSGNLLEEDRLSLK